MLLLLPKARSIFLLRGKENKDVVSETALTLRQSVVIMFNSNLKKFSI